MIENNTECQTHSSNSIFMDCNQDTINTFFSGLENYYNGDNIDNYYALEGILKLPSLQKMATIIWTERNEKEKIRVMNMCGWWQ